MSASNEPVTPMDDPRADLYAVLGVGRDATPSQIGRAYRALLRKYHPDTRSAADGDAAADTVLQRVLAAYAVLRDPKKRAAYDKRLTRAMPPARYSRPSRVRAYDSTQSPIRAGPVHWQPSRPSRD